MSLNALLEQCDAAACGDLTAAQAALDAGADIHGHRPFDGQSPVSLAFLNLHEDMLTFLVKQGADINHKDANGVPALAFAFGYERQSGQTDGSVTTLSVNEQMNVLRTALRHGASTSNPGELGWPISHLAAAELPPGALIELIGLGMDISQRSWIGNQTFLHALAERNLPKTPLLGPLIRTCVAEGVDPAALNTNQETASEVATVNKNKGFVACLEGAVRLKQPENNVPRKAPKP